MSRYNGKCLDHAPSPESDREWIERELVQAYIRLEVTAPDGYGYQTATAGPFGEIEVQLTELPRAHALSSIPPLWFEVFSRRDGATIDSYGCIELGEEELSAAVEMISNARQYSQNHS
jgi:hypothetical protein